MPNKTSKAGPISAMTAKDTVVIYVGKNKLPKHISKANFLALVGEGGGASFYAEDGTIPGVRQVDGDSNTGTLAFGEFDTLYFNGNDVELEGNNILRLSAPEMTFNGVEALYVAEVELSAAQIIAMNGAPVEVIGTPGAGKVIKIVDMTQILDYGTVTFTGGGEVVLFDSDDEPLTEAIPTASVTDTSDVIFVTGAVIAPHIAPPNSPIYITNDTAPFATGDGVLRLKITYRVFNTGL